MLVQTLCCILILFCVGLALFQKNLKKSIILVWTASIIIGFWYLYLGCEMMALLQLLLSSMSCLSFLFFYALMDQTPHLGSFSIWKKGITFLIAITLTSIFLIISFHLQSHEIEPAWVIQGKHIAQNIIEQHMTSIVLFAFSAMIGIIAGGAISRTRKVKDL